MNMNAKLKDLKGRIEALGPEMKQLGEKADRTAEENQRLDAIILEFTDLREQAEREIRLIRTSDQYDQLKQSTGSVTDSAAANAVTGQGQGGADLRQVDRRSIGQRFAESEAVSEWIASGGRGNSRKFSMGRSPIIDDTGRVVDGGPSLTYDGQGPLDRLAVISGTGLPSFMPAPMVLPDIVRPRDYALTMRQVIGNGRTTTDTVYYVKENVFTNAAAFVAESTAFSATTPSATNAKPESNLTFTQDSVAVKTLAHWVPITRQAIADNAQLQSYVEGRLLVGLERVLNSQIANGDGTGENLLGLLNATGVLDLDDAWFAAANPPLNDIGTANERFNRIARAMTVIDVSSDAMATFVALHPYDLEVIRTSTDANRNYFGQGPFVEGPIPTIWGLPVAKDRAIPQGTALVGDGTAAMYFDREDANILIGWINDQFIHNMLTILAELRGALAVFRGAAFAAVDITI